jgi:3-methyladenine DNA glycosylase AlkD
VEQYKIADEKNQKQIFNFYVKNFRYVNNWDLVDVTCRDVIGAYLFDKPKTLLYKLVQSKNLWYRRIAIISTFYFIQRKQYADSLKIAKLLLNDREDLIHKAVGWMLREIGKRSPAVEEKFLRKYASKMPRTMLRYAIEKFSPEIRRYYLSLS